MNAEKEAQKADDSTDYDCFKPFDNLQSWFYILYTQEKWS